MTLSIIQLRVRFDDRGIHAGLEVYRPHAGERLVGALTRARVSQAWNGSGTPTLHLWAGTGTGTRADAAWSTSFALDATEGVDLTGDGALRWYADSSARVDGDIEWSAYGPPLKVSVDNGGEDGDDPASTRGIAWLDLAFVTAAPVI